MLPTGRTVLANSSIANWVYDHRPCLFIEQRTTVSTFARIVREVTQVVLGIFTALAALYAMNLALHAIVPGVALGLVIGGLAYALNPDKKKSLNQHYLDLFSILQRHWQIVETTSAIGCTVGAIYLSTKVSAYTAAFAGALAWGVVVGYTMTSLGDKMFRPIAPTANC